MTQYAFSNRRQLIGLSLIGLLALAILWLVQAQTLTGLTIQPPAASSDTGSGATSIDSLAGVHPADRKFFAASYVSDRNANAILLDDVHPADRKFFTPNDGVAAPAASDPLAHIHPADRKFFAGIYVSDWNANAILLDDVHPADRKFFGPNDGVTAPADTSIHPADRKFLIGH